MKTALLNQYRVWDAPTRIFHWVNFTTVLLLIFMGLMMLFKKDMGITSLEAKITLKTIHVLIGYVFVLNLLVRLVWGFVGNRFARWSSILPGSGFGTLLSGYLNSIKKGDPQQFLGHNPLGRLAVTVIMLSLIVMAITGLTRAGTDIYYPPFGSYFAASVAAEGVDPASLKPYDKTGVDAAKMKELGAFKEPFGEIHIYTSYFLMFLILLHIFVVVRTEIKEGGGLVSAMISGRKVLSKDPEDMKD
ncbi:Ni,Fe-hydrogenase I cytochrome b subunit [Mariprofundus ferrinatatus]|uniref:Ni,Fe-hydrogenase I cytochrome b subunit n=1 Tax=Mariprofundus ferrinatatus TaxID=1921087 RepID=A0A2K8L226_9PROT|nr:cytochrome b/b6 domain-containing protein [Mariprofundus ferrinatatus]ATX81380.1 Ni,Fe-hydrogenase I cytochrome b subunit [Mariprofundus ferrinatatus]